MISRFSSGSDSNSSSTVISFSPTGDWPDTLFNVARFVIEVHVMTVRP